MRNDQPRLHKQEKKEALLLHLAAEFINRESNRGSLITVTRIDLARDNKHATIFVSVLPVTKLEAALSFLSRQRQEFRNYVESHSRIGAIPIITFAADPSIAESSYDSPVLDE